MSEINSGQVSPDLLPLHLETTVDKFEANGHTYHVEREARLSVARDRWLEKFSIYALLGREPTIVLREIRKAYDALNQARPLDAGVTLDNLMKGLGDLTAKPAPAYYLCTLFINRADEDRKGYSLEYAQQKIADWEAAGIERDFFLSLGLSYLSFTSAQLEQLINLSSSLPSLNLQNPTLD